MQLRQIILLAFLLLPTAVFAQISENFLPASPQISVFPSSPEPFSSVSVEIQDYGADTSGMAISWRVNGRELTEYKNTRTASFTTGAPGSKSTVEAVFTAPGRQSVTAATTITPVYLDVIIEPQTYAPEFFAGRSLPSPGSAVLVTALVNAGAVSPTNLSYTWRVGQSVIEGGPLVGRNKVLITTPTYGAATIGLEVRNASGELLASENIALPSTNPEIHFYEVHSLYGVANRPITTSGVSLISNSLTVQAAPYHLDLRTYNTPSVTEWRVNNTESSVASGNPYEATFARQFGVGSAAVRFRVLNLAELLQSAEASFQINY